MANAQRPNDIHEHQNQTKAIPTASPKRLSFRRRLSVARMSRMIWFWSSAGCTDPFKAESGVTSIPEESYPPSTATLNAQSARALRSDESLLHGEGKTDHVTSGPVEISRG